MADLETTQSKLRSTPTAGVSGEHSAYYRRLLSAGYKGYIQGSIGGGALYGTIGLGIGAVVGLALAIPTGGASLWLIPALGGSFAMYGAHTFADIGKTAAIIADSADTNEKRRYLLDRYYETPNEHEAQEIKRQLEEVHESRKPEHAFHWRPAIIGAVIGILLVGITVALASQGIAPHFMLEGFEVLMHGFGVNFVAGHAIQAAAMPALLAVGAAAAAIGAAAGSLIGIDREYIRRWLDKAELAVHETGKAEQEIAAREQDVQRLAEAARRGDSVMASRATAEELVPGKIHVTPSTPNMMTAGPERNARPAPIPPEAIAGIKPDTQVRDVAYTDRVEQAHQMVPNV